MSELRVKEGRIPGVLQLFPTVHSDHRGVLVKTIEKSWFDQASISCDWPEQFYSRSNAGVVRGLHFQLPPADHQKLVFCVNGTALDVVVDLRVGSPTYGEAESFLLDDVSWCGVVIPRGLAHGFAALRDNTVMAYATSTEYDASRDAGIRWDSAPLEWPMSDPVVSDRDRALPRFEEFVSPFTFSS